MKAMGGGVKSRNAREEEMEGVVFKGDQCSQSGKKDFVWSTVEMNILLLCGLIKLLWL
jgi:hypothetical protein